MKQEILIKLNLGEDHERECKLATSGLPESIWETYSSFANTNGGTILLGIKEHRDSFTIEGLKRRFGQCLRTREIYLEMWKCWMNLAWTF